MSVLSFKEVMLGGYTIIPMMLPLLKALLELSLEPSSYYFEYPQWWQIIVFWGWIWILETSKSHLEPSLLNKVGDQDGYCHFWSKIGCNYKIMRLISWVIDLCICFVLSHTLVLKTVPKKNSIHILSSESITEDKYLISCKDIGGENLHLTKEFLVCFSASLIYSHILSNFQLEIYLFIPPYNFTHDRFLLILGNDAKSWLWNISFVKSDQLSSFILMWILEDNLVFPCIWKWDKFFKVSISW